MEGSFYKPVVMAIAGFDPGSGAGITADMKTFHSIGVYGTGVISCITAQNHNEFYDLSEIDHEIFKTQLNGLGKGYKIRSVKTGLLTKRTAEIIGRWKKKNLEIPIIADPVFTATAGRNFFTETDIEYLKESFFKYATLITPNLFEASVLSGIKIKSVEDMKKAGKKMVEEIGIPVLIKGGHLTGNAVDILFFNNSEFSFEREKIDGVNTHGSGCILSSAISAYIALGNTIKDAVFEAKKFITKIMEHPVLLDRTGEVIEP